MARLGPFVLIALLAVGAYFYHRAQRAAPDKYAPCAKMAAEKERAACRSQIDFAMSAGW